jgi:3-mercaptopropionate dioxygenase
MQTSQLLATPDQRLGNLIGSVRSVTTRQLGWAQTADLVAERLRQHLPAPDVLTAEERAGDPRGYTCHLLHSEADGSFSVVALAWLRGQATPVHDHVTWCVTGVIQGTEHEERYVLRNAGHLEQERVTTNFAGDVSGLAPPGDIHRVRNAGAQTAISLHIYGTDVSRLGSSIRRVYDAPLLSRIPGRRPASSVGRRRAQP